MQRLLKPDSQIIITTHHKPDADALGSSLGLFHFLKNKGYTNVTVISPTDFANFLHWMPSSETVIDYEAKTEHCKALVAAADFAFCLDFNWLKRINEMGQEVRNGKCQTILVDHHLDPENFDDYRLWDTSACSTAELIYRIIMDWGGKEAITKDIAECLYAGILTDTGNFRHDTTNATTHRIVADLLEAGAKSSYVQAQLYDNYSLDRQRFIGYCLAHKLEILPGLPVALFTITREELHKYKIITGDTEGLVNYGLSIKGIKLAALIVDRTKKIKMSFRGTGKFPCNEFAGRYFKGGGHFSAAGGESDDSLNNVVNQFKTHIKEYETYLV